MSSSPSSPSSPSSSTQNPKYFDLGSLNSSAPPDLSLNSLHQPRLSLELVPSDLSISLPDITTCSAPAQFIPSTSPSSHPPSDHSLPPSQPITYDLNRHPSKRWTSFSELGKSVLKLKSFERSTVHASSPYARPRLGPISPTSIYSTASLSNQTSLFKLFHPDHPIKSTILPAQPISTSSTLPILPPLSELLDVTTSFDHDFSSATHHPIITQELPELSSSPTNPLNPPTLIQNSSELTSCSDEQNAPSLVSPSPKTQSVLSSQSAPIVSVDSPSSPLQTSIPPTTLNQIHPVEKPEVNQAEMDSSPLAVISNPEEPVTESTIDQPLISHSSQTNQSAQTDDQRVNMTDEEVIEPNKDPLIDILDRSEELKSDQQSTSSKPCNSSSNSKTCQRQSKIGDATSSFLGKKKKSSETPGLIKLLFLKGLGHLKFGHSAPVHNDTCKTLVPTTSIHNH